MSDLPPPPLPADCDLQDFPFMPLHVARLRDSNLAAEEHPEACWYALLLWAASWHQVPAGSLPDNDAVLCRLIDLGRDLKTFRKHRAGALRGFTKCSDGRLYHSVVVEQALEAWTRKLDQRWRSEKARLKKADQRNNTQTPQPTFAEYVARDWPLSVPYMSPSRPDDVPGDEAAMSPGTPTEVPRENTSKRQRQGQRQGQYISPLPPDDGPAPAGAQQAEYVFAGRTIRLNQTDFDRWRSAYGGIPDLLAELQALDDWLQGESVSDSKRKGWFAAVSGMLCRKHEDALAAKQASAAMEKGFADRHPAVERSEQEMRLLLGDDEFERRAAARGAAAGSTNDTKQRVGEDHDA